jgi:hypothetical protein
MTGASLAKHYDQLKPGERFTLTLEALGRDDDPEIARLRSTCPKKVYRQSDEAYAGRMEASQIVGLAVCLEVMPLVARIQILQLLAETAVDWMEPAEHLMLMAFDEGEYCGWRMAHPDAAAEPVAGDAEEPTEAGEPRTDDTHEADETAISGEAENHAERESADPAESDAEAAGVGVDPISQGGINRVKRLAAILGKGTGLRIGATAEWYVETLATTWIGFRRFCHAELRVEPETLFRAWGLPLDGIAESLAAFPDERPDEQRAAELAAMFHKGWEMRVRNE